MDDIASLERRVNAGKSTATRVIPNPANNSHSFAWGADEIGRVIGRSARQTHHLLAHYQIKSARKVGGRWVTERAALLREFGA